MDTAPVNADTPVAPVARVILRRLAGGALFLCLVSVAERYYQLQPLGLIIDAIA